MSPHGETLYQVSMSNPAAFWRHASEAIEWDVAPQKILDDTNAPFYRWFAGGKLNTCFNAVDRHVLAGRGEQIALHYISPVTGAEQQISYQSLLAQVERLAGLLVSLGVEKGDRVVIYMPMVPETAYAMLACARIGAIHSVVFGGFAANELASRINHAKPKVVLSASCGVEPSGVIAYKPLLDNALAFAEHKVEHCVILQRSQCSAHLEAPRDLDWQSQVAMAQAAPCVSLDATDPLYILYTSGTTGQPKGVVRDNGGHAVAIAWSMKHIYDIDAGDVFWAASDVGWVVGHSYIVYGPLLVGAASIMYEGKPVGTPDAGAFWRIIERYKVKSFFTAPTAMRAIKREDPLGEQVLPETLTQLKHVFLAGERCDPETLNWSGNVLKRPVIDHWWQTETGWPVASNMMGAGPIAIKPGSPAKPVPGYCVEVLDAMGKPVAAGESGNVVIKLPLPPGCLTTLWQNDKRYLDSYLAMYPGYYLTGDAGYFDEDGYLFIMSRIDDIINVAGHRLSTGRFEEVLCQHSAVAEAAVIGVQDKLKGQLPLGLVVLKHGVDLSEEDLCAQLLALVRQEVGAVASFKLVSAVQKLPKTRSGKILRATMRNIADNQSFTMPATIEDPQSLDIVRSALIKMGYADAMTKALN
ncbi:propionyl-CoA synthetase [Shewanella sp. SR44-3]|uniref:propionyl-CoA synthetase n=1 Tax=unclassified Shewanella TaxID=196818 RepID=UPI0015F903B2|nr:propionyl-CoA synthetase [Shewanella sp. SR44-3]MBB1270609.1 propionyl-CoA synthetase [Shewanella sp. SR44-3]